jgi:hypothetical protein
MIPNCFRPDDEELSAREPLVSQVEMQQQLLQTFRELRDLLEQYAPAWYPHRLQKKVGTISQWLER